MNKTDWHTMLPGELSRKNYAETSVNPGKTSVLKQKASRKYQGCISSLIKPTLPHLECLNYPVASGQIHWKKHINICLKCTFQDVNWFRMGATAALPSSPAKSKWVPSTNWHVTATMVTQDRISWAISAFRYISFANCGYN